MTRRFAFLSSSLAAAAIAAVLAGCATALPDSQFGLRKASVFEVLTPAPFGFDKPGQAIAPLPGSGMPPMIAHAIDEGSRMTVAANDCLDCHDKPHNIGKPVAAGKARPAPASHYTGLNAALPPAGAPALKGTVYNCTGCHVPQADVPALVRNDAR